MVPAHFHDITHDKKENKYGKKYGRTTLESLFNQNQKTPF